MRALQPIPLRTLKKCDEVRINKSFGAIFCRVETNGKVKNLAMERHVSADSRSQMRMSFEQTKHGVTQSCD
jgi:hypothetical protein